MKAFAYLTLCRLFRKSIFGEADEIELKFMNRCSMVTFLLALKIFTRGDLSMFRT